MFLIVNSGIIRVAHGKYFCTPINIKFKNTLSGQKGRTGSIQITKNILKKIV
jgi:hypothetical protein